MPLRQLLEVPGGGIEDPLKWAGSAKILGCYKRVILILLVLFNNIQNIWTENDNLKVTFSGERFHKSTDYFNKWNYWKFEFSPHRNKAERIIADIDCVGYYSQVRSQTHLTKTIKSISGGTKYILKQGNNNNWYSTFFRSRGIVAEKLGYIRLKAKQNKFQHQGIIGDGSKAYCVINYIIYWLKYRRMDILRTTEKRKRSNDILQDEVLGEEMDLSTDSDTSLQQQVSIGLLQEDKYWVTICELIDNLSKFQSEHIGDAELAKVMRVEMKDIADLLATLGTQRTELAGAKKDVIVHTFEMFIQKICNDGNQEIEETYTVVGYAARITYELTCARLVKEMEKELQACKIRLDQMLQGQEAETVRNELESVFFGYRVKNLQRLASTFNDMRATMLTGKANQIAIKQLGIVSLQEGTSLLEEKIADHVAAVESFLPAVIPVKETVYQVISAPPKLPPRLDEIVDDTVDQQQLTIGADIADLRKQRDSQRGIGHVKIAPPTYVWHKNEDPITYLQARKDLIEYLTYADEWIDMAHYVYMIGFNFKDDAANRGAYKARILKEIENAFAKIGHYADVGRLAVSDKNEWEVDVNWYNANIEALRTRSFRTGFSNGIPVKLKKPVIIAVVGTFNTFKTISGVKSRIGQQNGQYVYDMIHMVASDLETTAKNNPREYWIMALPATGQWEQLWNNAAPLWVLTGIHSAPEDKYVLAAEILCAKKKTLDELNQRGAGFTEENVLPILDQYWTEWDISTEPPTFVPKNRKFEGRKVRKPVFLLRMVYVNKGVAGGASFCQKYQSLMRDKYERQFVAYGFRMERFLNDAEMENSPVPLAETLTAHQTILLNVVEGVKASEVLDELLLNHTNWKSFQKAGQVIICPGTVMKFKTVAPTLRIMWLKEIIKDSTQAGIIESVRNYHPITLVYKNEKHNIDFDISRKFATYQNQIILFETVSDTRKDFLEVAERFAKNSRQILTPIRKKQDSPGPVSKQRKKGTPTKGTPKTSDTEAMTVSTMSSERSSSESRLTRYSDDGFNQLFSKMMDIEEKVNSVRLKQSEQEQDIKQVRLEAAGYKDEHSRTQLNNIINKLDILGEEIDKLRGDMTDRNEQITVLQKMTSTDILTLQIMQLQSNMRSDQRDEEGKIRRYRILREEASRLAAAVNPPVTLENLIRHDL